MLLPVVPRALPRALSPQQLLKDAGVTSYEPRVLSHLVDRMRSEWYFVDGCLILVSIVELARNVVVGASKQF